MRAVVQRVSRAKASVDQGVSGEIGRGLLVLLGVGQSDRDADAEYLAQKIAGLRIFEDEQGKMNRSVGEVQGGVLVVSQFTLYVMCGVESARPLTLPHPLSGPVSFMSTLSSASVRKASPAPLDAFRKRCKSNW